MAQKTQKPLWFLGFPNRYLFRFAMLVAEDGFEPLTIPLRSPKCAVLAIARRISTAAEGFLFAVSATGGAHKRPQVIRPRAHNPTVGAQSNLITEEIRNRKSDFGFLWLRRMDLNHRPSGYEPDELPLLHPAIFSSLERLQCIIIFTVCQELSYKKNTDGHFYCLSMTKNAFLTKVIKKTCFV